MQLCFVCFLVLALALTSCSADDEGPSAPTAPASTVAPSTSDSSTSSTTTTNSTTTTGGPETDDENDPRSLQYLPDREARLFLPSNSERAPVVIMVPGGGWRTADPSGLTHLGNDLSERGLAVMTVRIGAARDGVVYPTPLQDIRCALGFAVDQVRQSGIRPGPVVLLGHSSGAHLASLVALQDRPPPEECSQPVPEIQGLVGLAGVYDIERLPTLAFLLLGETPDEEPDLWEEANPLLQAESKPDLPVLLLHGDADPLVPVSFSEDFLVALQEGDHTVTLEVLSAVDHRKVYAPDVTGEIIADWVHDLAGG